MSNTFKDMPEWVRGWLLPIDDPRVSVHHSRDCINHPVHGRWGNGRTGVDRPCDLAGPISRTGTPRADTCQMWGRHAFSSRRACSCCQRTNKSRGRETRNATRTELRSALLDYNTSGDFDVDVAWG